MNSYRDKLKYKIRQEQARNPSVGRGIIQKVYPETYTCDIMIVENTDQGKGHMAFKVPLPMIGGMSYVLPHHGDMVLLNFVGGDMNYPMIVQTYPSSTMQLVNHTTIPTSTVVPLSDFR